MASSQRALASSSAASALALRAMTLRLSMRTSPCPLCTVSPSFTMTCTTRSDRREATPTSVPSMRESLVIRTQWVRYHSQMPPMIPAHKTTPNAYSTGFLTLTAMLRLPSGQRRR